MVSVASWKLPIRPLSDHHAWISSRFLPGCALSTQGVNADVPSAES
jgi:hypothetical protein